MTHFNLVRLSFLFDVLLPPRKTELLVRRLNLESLKGLASLDGTLPYHEVRVRALVWELKYRRSVLALTLAAQFLLEKVLEASEEGLGAPLLIPIPMHERRKAERGFNQTEILCEALVNESRESFEYLPQVLVRTRHTVPQQGLPKHRRMKNVAHSMEVTEEERVRGRVCIVIDDVKTTGATGEEAKRALLQAGAKEVHIITLAHS